MTREEKLAAAGEYVVGAMEDAERAAFEATLAQDTELATMVARLQNQLQALDDTATPVALDQRLWSDIEARLGTQDVSTSAAAPRAVPRRLRSLMPMAAGIAVALGLGFAAGLLARPETPPVVIAVLLDADGNIPGAIVEAFSDNSVRVVPLEAFEVPAGRVLEVWTLPDPATGPVSLGTFADPQSIRLQGANLPRPQPGQLYEITLEPSPGSPTGRPTGPILAKGLARIPL